jgi:hypothetical protein
VVVNIEGANRRQYRKVRPMCCLVIVPAIFSDFTVQRKLRLGLLDNHSFHINKYHQLEVSNEAATDALIGNRYKDIYFELVPHKVRRLYLPLPIP